MTRLMIISLLDYEKQPNNREHHLVRYYAGRFKDVALVYRRRNAPGRLPRMLLDVLLPRWRVFMRENVTFVEVNPLFNHYPGLSRDLTGHHPGASSRGRVRTLLYPFVAAVGALRDVFFLPCTATAALLGTRGRFDVCLAMGPWGSLVGMTLRLLGKAGCLIYVDRDNESAILVPRFRRRALERIESFLLRRADLVISIGHRLARLREQQSGRTVHVVPTGVDYALFAPAQVRTAHARPTLIYTGNLAFWSGLDLVVSALPDIRRRVRAIRLLIVGGGVPSYEEMLRRLVADLGLEETVTFLGVKRQAELPALLGEADVGLAFFQPTVFRQFAVPLKVFEYMAAGLPVIGTRGTETEEILRRHDCGRAVEYTREAFAGAVCDLLEDRAARARMAANAARHSREFEWTSVLDREYALIREACARARPARQVA